MESKKAISPLMLAIVVIIIGLLTLVFAIIFFGSISEKAGGEFFKLFKTTEQTCQEKCTIQHYTTGTCIPETEECSGGVFTGTSDCKEGEVCCCT